MRVKIGTYGEYSRNYGCHCQYLVIGTLVLYFSYETVVAFREDDGELVISENIWGPTTGKHLNQIDDDKEKRISRSKFVGALEAVLAKHDLVVG